MSTTTYGAPQETIDAIKKLNDTINENNKITSKSNNMLIVLTCAMFFIGLVQLVVMLIQIFKN